MSCIEYRACDDCAHAIKADDFSTRQRIWVDQLMTAAEASEETNRAEATVEALGPLSYVAESKGTGVFDCIICDEHQYGGGAIFRGPER